ncbi:methyltransferase [Amycolatopsis kentuckyensis]|uniref:methyltransferase n=1 Tax=Amycolatopsis kentuckyensis TaxID=218823 RepID=UPI0011780B89|nr:methyltransferase [Amycolatopsis kentuckyensis]
MDSNGPARLSDTEKAGIRLFEETLGYVYSAALRAAADVGVADHLADGPKTVAELARATGVHAENLHRVLRALAMRGVFREDEAGRFELTPEAELLRTDVPGSLRSAVLTFTDKTFWNSHGELAHSVRHGDASFDQVFGTTFFDYFRDVESPGTFYSGMQSKSDSENASIVRNLTFPPGATVVDVGGGYGGLLLEALRADPSLKGVLFDLGDHVVAGHRLGELGDDGRWELITGDFFEACPPADVYLLKHIIHDWNDEQCVRILRNCRRALSPGGRIIVLDTVIPPRNEPHLGKLFDIMVMSILPGRERTEEQFRALLAEAGLELTRVVDTGFAVSVVEAVVR